MQGANGFIIWILYLFEYCAHFFPVPNLGTGDQANLRMLPVLQWSTEKGYIRYLKTADTLQRGNESHAKFIKLSSLSASESDPV